MKNLEFNQLREIVLFSGLDSLEVFEDSDQLFNNFIYEIYGSAAPMVLSGLDSKEMQ